MKNILDKIFNSNFYKIFKEELILIPLIAILFLLANRILQSIFTSSAFFDPASQFETLLYGLLTYTMIFWSTHLMLRITLPKVYNVFTDAFYHKFEQLNPSKQIDYAFKLFIVFALIAGLVYSAKGDENPNVRSKLINLLDSQLNIRETDPNRGPEVDVFLKSVGVTPPASWCGAYVAYDMKSFSIKNPNSGWSPAYANPKDIIWQLKKKIVLIPYQEMFLQNTIHI